MVPTKFGGFNVTSQVFYKSPKSFGIVNLRPLLPGHVLVCPVRSVARFRDMTNDEVVDFFLTVKKVSDAIESYYHADAMNIAIQDGALAGQSIAHVHCHIIPRRLKDLANVDDIYKLLDENNFEEAYRLMRESGRGQKVDNPKRSDRSSEEMSKEARQLEEFINKTQS